MIIAGKEDQVVPVANSLVLWRKIGLARLVVFEDVGHGVLFAYGEESVNDIVVFLDGAL